MRVAITRLEEKSEDTKDLFQRYGAGAVIAPSMRAEALGDTRPLLSLIDRVKQGEVDFLVFTSSLGVDKWVEYGGGFNTRVVSVGPSTAEKLEEHGVKSEYPDSYSADQIPEYLGDRVKDRIVGIARANVSNPDLVRGLEELGAVVVEAPAYELRPVRWDPGVLDKVDAVVFTSGRSFEYAGVSAEQLSDKRVVAIGPKTAEYMRQFGVEPDLVAEGTIESCLQALGLTQR